MPTTVGHVRNPERRAVTGRKPFRERCTAGHVRRLVRHRKHDSRPGGDCRTSRLVESEHPTLGQIDADVWNAASAYPTRRGTCDASEQKRKRHASRVLAVRPQLPSQLVNYPVLVEEDGCADRPNYLLRRTHGQFIGIGSSRPSFPCLREEVAARQNGSNLCLTCRRFAVSRFRFSLV